MNCILSLSLSWQRDRDDRRLHFGPSAVSSRYNVFVIVPPGGVEQRARCVLALVTLAPERTRDNLDGKCNCETTKYEMAWWPAV